MKKVLFGFLGLLFSVPVLADSGDRLSLGGRIVYADSNEPVVGLHISWKDSNGQLTAITTDENGEYEDRGVGLDINTELTLSLAGCNLNVRASDLVSRYGKDAYVFDCKTELSGTIVYGEKSSKGQPGCDDEDNEFIAPDLALCTTHVYNIGDMENPSNETTRAYMQEVIALKTTFMTQQMNKQYEYLESMIRRFKTQLEKAILTTRLQAAGTTDVSTKDQASLSFKSDGRNVFIADAENCNDKLLPADVLTCLNTNLTTISSMSNNGSEVSSDIRKQFINDFALLESVYDGKACSKPANIDCSKEVNLKKRANFQKCMDEARSCIRNKMYNLNLESQKNSK